MTRLLRATRLRAAYLSSRLLLLASSGCVSYSESFSTAGTMATTSGAKPIHVNMSLIQCAHSAIEIGTSCRLPVRFDSGGKAFVRSFELAERAPSCTIDGHHLLVQGTSGKQDVNGLVEATVTAADEKAELVVLTLHGTQVASRQLDSECRPLERD